jgi:hypothetical protein
MTNDSLPLASVEHRYPGVLADIAEITPEIATELLAHNTHNRRLKETKISQMVRDILAGDWTLNGEAIKFSENGTLLDGQNRLTAVVLAEKSIDSFVIYGLPDLAQRSMDQGVKRTFADSLTMDGEPNARAVQAIVNLLLRDLTQERRHNPTQGEMDAYHNGKEAALQVAAVAGNRYRRYIPGLLLPVAGAAYYLITEKVDSANAEEFFEAMAENRTAGRGDPRRALMAQLGRDHNRRTTRDRNDQLNMVLKAWKAWHAGMSLTVFRNIAGSKFETPL